MSNTSIPVDAVVHTTQALIFLKVISFFSVKTHYCVSQTLRIQYQT